LQRDLIYKNEECIGIDIGSSCVKAVQLKKKKSLTKLVFYDSISLPENIVIEGIIAEPEVLAKTIKEMLSKKDRGIFSAKKVVASIPDVYLFTRVLELPYLKDKELAEAVFWEVDQSIPMAVTDLVVDWQILGPSLKEDLQDVLIIASPRSIVNSYVQLFAALDLKAEAIESSMVANTRSLISAEGKDDVAIIIDWGGKSITMGVYDKTLLFSDSLDFGGDKMTSLISGALKIDLEKAENLKKEEGLNDKKAADALGPLLTTVSNEIKRVIRYHDERNNDSKKTKKLILTGGVAPMPGLTEYFSSLLNIETIVGNPWTNINTYPLKAIPKSEAPGFANAIGLSLRSFEEER